MFKNMLVYMYLMEGGGDVSPSLLLLLRHLSHGLHRLSWLSDSLRLYVNHRERTLRGDTSGYSLPNSVVQTIP